MQSALSEPVVGDDVLTVIIAVLEELDDAMAKFLLPDHHRSDIEVEYEILHAQITAPRPKHRVFEQSLQNLRYLLTDGSAVCPAMLMQNIAIAQTALAYPTTYRVAPAVATELQAPDVAIVV